MYDTITTPSPLAKKATKVATIFDVLAWLVLIAGGLVAVGMFIGGLITTEVGISMSGVLAAALTAIYWASISMGSIVAQYIANRA